MRPTAEPENASQRPFGEPEGTPPLATTQLSPPEQRWEVKRDLVGYDSSLEIVKDRGTVRYDEIGLDVGCRAFERYTATGDDFTSVGGESDWTMRLRRDEWDVSVRTRTTLRCDEDHFFVDATLDGYEGERRVFSRTWKETLPRDWL